MDTSGLIHLLNQKARNFSKELNDQVQPHGLYASQWTILYILMKNGPMTQTEIWKYLQVEAPTVTRTLAKMEENGWVSRQYGRDRRERIAVITDEAKQQLPKVKESVEQMEHHFTGSLTREEAKQLYTLLQKLGIEERRV
ncbi:MarR family winged helix-turn-helix transcriptional regulator [Salibacterium halotolerans]|uniref:DNA-binding transcriptional regulator, MarR family n=1 Tax=Salibacterium halotolerans TaxID=1884432 RepID=A0A1I5LYK8_9BACI|nr:MarR family transcriptional regulator [Salibacterium halotolerans]SFP01846.1 DNA-binding transcriptional regulator, MarR family [Salibacterium halotolerans]